MYIWQILWINLIYPWGKIYVNKMFVFLFVEGRKLEMFKFEWNVIYTDTDEWSFILQPINSNFSIWNAPDLIPARWDWWPAVKWSSTSDSSAAPICLHVKEEPSVTQHKLNVLEPFSPNHDNLFHIALVTKPKIKRVTTFLQITDSHRLDICLRAW